MRGRIVEPASDYEVRIFEARRRNAEPFHSVAGKWHWLEIGNDTFDGVHVVIANGFN